MSADEGRVLRVALLGNPNTGKTTLFNQLTGLRHKTSNFAGTTLEAREGLCGRGAHPIEVVDLPGLYSLELDYLEAEVCRQVLAGRVAPRGQPVAEPDGVLVVMDATNLSRNLPLTGEVLRRRLPTVIALNMTDLAAERGILIEPERLSRALGCVVVPICARSGAGIDELIARMSEQIGAGIAPTATPPGDENGLRAWADAAFASSVSGGGSEHAEKLTDTADRLVLHPLVGSVIFACVMGLLFAAIFWLASFPMGWIEWVFSAGASVLKGWMPEGLLRDLLTDGVLAGVGATVVFVPQIALLFLIAILEDTGYLSRAAFVMDRVLRPFGLPGHAFVPLLSSHACALPGIMATRCIPDVRERLATILAAPFMTCSARIPVYVLLTGMLFPHEPMKAALAFVGCYALGLAAGLFSVLIARRTILRGTGRAMALELPSYKRPCVKNALTTAFDRSFVFLRKAGTTILAVSVILWWLGAFPRVGPSAEGERLRQQAAQIAPADEREAANARADAIDARHAKAHSFLGRMGRVVEPTLAPLGCDWQLSIGVLASFAARETFVGTMSIVVSGAEEDDESRLRDELAAATRSDGAPLFSAATCWSLLVFYVLAMQCLPTLVVSARESGHAKWALLQLVWMSVLAYAGAFIAFRVASGTFVSGSSVPVAPGVGDAAGWSMPMASISFWLVTLLAVIAAVYLLRNVLPIKGLARRKQSRTRATLTIGGKPIERD